MHLPDLNFLLRASFRLRDLLQALPTLHLFLNQPLSKHDKVVSLVEQMLELHKKLGGAKLSNEKKMIQRWIDATDSEIDRLVYDLYGLTYEEIKIVEEVCS